MIETQSDKRKLYLECFFQTQVYFVNVENTFFSAFLHVFEFYECSSYRFSPSTLSEVCLFSTLLTVLNAFSPTNLLFYVHSFTIA